MIVLVFSCQQTIKKEDTNIQSDETIEIKENSKRIQYQDVMRQKEFSMTLNGPCDDATDDTIHEIYVSYIEAKLITDSSATIDFKFIGACCLDFMGDYKIHNDTLLFEFEHVNNEPCICECWYRYKLKFNKLNTAVNHIDIKRKKHLPIE